MWEIDTLSYKIRCILDHKIIGPILIFIKKRYQKRFGKSTRINIGGGNFLNKRWGNLDYVSPGYPYKDGVVDFNFDLTSDKPLPFESNSIYFFYSCHCIEHIPNEHFEHIFSEIYRCLKPGGGVRFSTPDFRIYLQMYMENRKNEPEDSREAQDKFIYGFASSLKGKIPVKKFRDNFMSMNPTELADFYCSQASREIQRDNAGNHINWWDYNKLEGMLINAGFEDVRLSKSFKSQFPEMRKKIKVFGLEKICSLQGMLGFDSKAEEIQGGPDISIYVEAIK